MASSFQQVWESIQRQDLCSPLIRDLTDQESSIDSPVQLGQLYEQSFSNGSNRVGAVYTPLHIVDYIINGCLRNNRSNTPTVLDPACGAGYFLLQAFQRLIDRERKRLCRGLNDDELRELLTSSIFGVDLDDHAVEVTKHALALRLFENRIDDPGDCAPLFSDVFDELSQNIISANSLTGRAFTGQREISFDDTSLDWSSTFPLIANQGGFDIIVGNPPYRRELDFAEPLEEVARSPLGKYRTARMDLWYYFVHRSIELLKPNGTLSFIVNSYWTSSRSANKLIEHIRSETNIEEIFDLQLSRVFANVEGRHMIFRLRKSHDPVTVTVKSTPDDFRQDSSTLFEDGSIVDTTTVAQSELFDAGRLRVIRSHRSKFLEGLEALPRLRDFGDVRQGIAENPACINQRTNRRFDHRWNVGDGVFVLTKKEVESLNLSVNEASLLRPYHELKDLGRYFRNAAPSKRLIYSTRHTWPELQDCPALANHLNDYRDIMMARRETRQASNSWWHLHWPRDEQIWIAPKLLCIQMAERPSFVPAFDPTYVPFSVNVFIPNDNSPQRLLFFAAVLNSRLLWHWFRDRAKQRGVGLEINGHVLKEAPIKIPDLNNTHEHAVFERLADLAQHRLEHQHQSPTPETDDTEQQIDQLVCKLYNIEFGDIAP